MKRENVYEVINEERNFQNTFIKDKFRHSESDKSVPAELIMMQVYLTKAMNEWTNFKGDTNALHQVRKVVALGIRCFENHGCPKRGKNE